MVPHFDLYLTAPPQIPADFQKLSDPIQKNTAVFRSPMRNTQLQLQVLTLNPNHQKKIADKRGLPKLVDIPSNSLLRLTYAKDREGQRMIQLSVLPGGADRSLWEM